LLERKIPSRNTCNKIGSLEKKSLKMTVKKKVPSEKYSIGNLISVISRET
jgi:hypothetical protein